MPVKFRLTLGKSFGNFAHDDRDLHVLPVQTLEHTLQMVSELHFRVGLELAISFSDHFNISLCILKINAFVLLQRQLFAGLHLASD